MAKGWFMVKFEKKEVVDWVLGKNWAFSNHPVMFKRWTLLFDVQREKVEDILVWVCVPGLPPFLWVESVFKSIGNQIGTYLKTNMSFIQLKDKAMARILVRLNPREGLVEDIKIQYKEFIYV